MSLAHPLIDSWVSSIVEAFGIQLSPLPDRRPSAAFALLCARILLDLSDPELLPFLTDGPSDLGIDLMYVHDADPTSFTVPVTLFQAKYSVNKDKRERQAFPENDVVKLLHAIKLLFDPNKTYEANERLTEKVEEVRAFIHEGFEPKIRVVACGMGSRWDASAQKLIDESGLDDSVTWEHLEPTQLLALRRGPQEISTKFPLIGPVIKEGFGFHTSLVGRAALGAVYELIETHGEALIDRNVRRYLGGRNRVNSEIARTIRDEKRRKDFFFLNNGLTFVCSKLTHNQIQEKNHILRTEGLQLINGAQTAFTIHRVLKQLGDTDSGEGSVLVRIYQLEENEDPELVSRIIRATNSQSPVELHDLRANDPIQRDLELGLSDLGYTYLRQQRANGSAKTSISPTEAAAAVLAVWRRRPDLARFQRNQHFGSLYDRIFRKDLTATQVVDAVLAVRFWGELDESTIPSNGPAGRFVYYSRFHLAMRALESGHDGNSLHAYPRHFLALFRLGISPTTANASTLSAAHRRPELAVSLEVLRADAHAASELSEQDRSVYQQALLTFTGEHAGLLE